MTTSSKPKQRALSLRSTIWIYFALFTGAILFLVWFFQVFTLDRYYELSTRSKLKTTADTIALGFDSEDPVSSTVQIENLAHDNTMTIVVCERNGKVLIVSDFRGGYSVLTQNQGIRLFLYRRELNESEDGWFLSVAKNERFNTTEYVYGVLLDDDYMLFINASLEPIGPAVEIIKEQLVFITLMTFFIGLFVTLMLSNRLSRPFKQITAAADKLASGDYSTRFESGGYAEINELSDALNYAASEISKVDSLRNDLVANVSHDLRTPLTMIKAYAEMIRDLSGDNPEKRAEHLGVIIDEADRLSELVSNLLELSKLQNGNVELNRRQFSISDFIDSALSRYRLLSEKEGYKFEVDGDDDVICYGDDSRLAQVLYNFINNAVNYSGDSRRIIIRQRNYEKVVRIEVIDFGVGIEREKLPLIFDRYYRDERTKRDVVGTGLGLSIVKEILRLHNMHFGVQSEVGKGSTFWFEIQRAEE